MPPKTRTRRHRRRSTAKPTTTPTANEQRAELIGMFDAVLLDIESLVERLEADDPDATRDAAAFVRASQPFKAAIAEVLAAAPKRRTE
jgi:hypothetical protein